jgi:hypothetical protein
MPCKQQSLIPTVYQTHVFAKLHQQIKHWLRLKKLLKHWKAKYQTAMPAHPKFLVLLAIFLLARSGDALMNLSLAAGDLVPVNHLIQFEEPMNDPTKIPSR